MSSGRAVLFTERPRASGCVWGTLMSAELNDSAYTGFKCQVLRESRCKLPKPWCGDGVTPIDDFRASLGDSWADAKCKLAAWKVPVQTSSFATRLGSTF